jgi:hypothetical protein
MSYECDELAKLLFVTDNDAAPEPEHKWEMTTRHNPEYAEYSFAMADAILAAGYRKPRTVGYVAVGVHSNGLDWDEAVYESEDAVIDSLCGPYQPFSRAPESPDYWGREYRICAITELHEAPND